MYFYVSLVLHMTYQENDQHQYTPDIKEQQPPLHNEKIVVIGGASGTGAQLSKAIHGLGAEVIVSSTKQDKLDGLSQTLGQERIHTFVADLTKPEQFSEELERLIISEGIVPTSVVHSAAGGMESFSRAMIKDIARLRNIADPQEYEKELQALRKKIAEAVLKPENAAAAMAVNFEGHVYTVNKLKELLPSGAQVKDIYWSSIWSDLGKMHPAFKGPNAPSDDTSEEIGVDVPTFYLGVAGSKGRFVRWQREHAGELVQNGIYPAIVSGHIIQNSDVGRMIDRFIFSTLLPKEQHEEMKKYYITQQDMVDATLAVIQSDPETWTEYPHKVFVVGGRPVSRELSPDDPMFKVKIPL